MAWTPETTPETLTNVTATEQFFDAVLGLKTKEIVRFRVEVDFPVTPNNGLIIAIYPSNDGTTFAQIAEILRLVSSDDDPNSLILKVRDMPAFRVGVKSDGTDTIPSVEGAFARDDGLA